MVESGRVPRKGRIRESFEKTVSANTEEGSNQCQYRKNGGIEASTGKRSNPCEYRKSFPTNTGKGSNECEYRKMEESGRVPGKLSRRIPKRGRMSVSIEKW